MQKFPTNKYKKSVNNFTPNEKRAETKLGMLSANSDHKTVHSPFSPILYESPISTK
jgi:hypothetical protein